MRPSFLTPHIERLNADGTTEVVHAADVAARWLQRPVMLLGRELCSFSLFKASSLPRMKRRQAAELYARAHAPFNRSDFILTKSGNDFGIWWWDKDRVEALMPPETARNRPTICPETLTHPITPTTDETWRMVKLASGYEAQLWVQKLLVASAWRRERFDPASWGAFVRLQRTTFAAPEQPPAASVLPLNYDPRLVRSPVSLSREKMALMAGAGLVTASLCLAAFFYGQALSVQKSVDEVEAETAQMRQRLPQPTRSQGPGNAKEILVAYQTLENQTNPLTSSGAAIGILAYHDISPKSLRSDALDLSLVISNSHLDKIDLLVDDLSNSGYFYDIRPRSERSAQNITIEMKVREAAPPLADLG